MRVKFMKDCGSVVRSTLLSERGASKNFQPPAGSIGPRDGWVVASAIMRVKAVA